MNMHHGKDSNAAVKSTFEQTLRQRADARVIALTLAAREIVVEDIAEGVRKTVKRMRRVSPLERLTLPPGCYNAAILYRQAWEHVSAERGMGPMPWGRDVGSRGSSEQVYGPMRALSAAEWLRRGYQAMGQIASGGVVYWVVIAGLPLCEYDTTRQWREGRGMIELGVADRKSVV